jgi:hypothetical protein
LIQDRACGHCYSSCQSISQIMSSQRRCPLLRTYLPAQAPHRLPLPLSLATLSLTLPPVRTQPQSPPVQSSAGNITQPTVNASPPTVMSITAHKRWCSSNRPNIAATFIGLGAGVYHFYVQYVLTVKNDTRETWRDSHSRAVIVFN